MYANPLFSFYKAFNKPNQGNLPINEELLFLFLISKNLSNITFFCHIISNLLK